MDCSYILVLAELGIVGFILVELIWFTRAVLNIKKVTGNNRGTFLLCLTVFYLVESVLEGYPPFGPGVSSFMFWFLSAAFSDAVSDNMNNITGETEG